MTIKELKNPLTQEYLSLKKIIISFEIPWQYAISTSGDQGKFYFSHRILTRPTEQLLAPNITSNYFDLAIEVLSQIIKYNNLKVNSFMRINVNLTINHGGGPACDPHYDHTFPHKNLLIYLNQASGPTVSINSYDSTEEYFHPKEDAIITFEGEHYQYQPNIGEKRIVLVATYI